MHIVQVDSFTSEPFSGNPAAVCVLGSPVSDERMQAVAREMNLSETAFLVRRGDVFDLRWFTPTVEVDLCGHATLAAAHVLWDDGHLDPSEPAVFETSAGRLEARRRGEGWIEMDFPAEPPAEAPLPPVLVCAIGMPVEWGGRNRLDYIAVLATEADVRQTMPDLTLLATVEARGLIITAASGSNGFDFVSRFFAPRVGVPEDPVTGSAHCALGPYWAGRLGRSVVTGRQVSTRGGVVRVECSGERVLLVGQAVTVLRAHLLV
jgi:predicted PhzF superfamily epimerase YddE/YHI9